MEIAKKIDFSNWYPYDGISEGSGRSEKIWLQSPEGKIGLFKFPKNAPDTKIATTEHISEHMAHQIGDILGVKTACVDIGTYGNREGCMSYLLNKPNEHIVEGAIFISGLHPDYDLELMQEKESERYYCMEHLFEISDLPAIKVKWIEMMLFDFIIGNSDRHQNNWAFLACFDTGQETSVQVEVCPLYDNGSSLCCYVNEDDVLKYLGKDFNRFKALTDTKSRSMIRIDGLCKKHPTHLEVVSELFERYPEAYDLSEKFVSRLTENIIDELMQCYIGILSDNKRELIARYLKRKVALLKEFI